MQDSRHKSIIRTCLYLLIGAVAAAAVIRYILPCCIPFIFALLTARIAEPAIRFLCSHFGFKRGFSSFFCILVLILALTGIFFLAATRLFSQAVDFIRDLPQLCSDLPQIVARAKSALDRYIYSAPIQVQDYLLSAWDGFADMLSDLPAELSAAALSRISAAASGAPALFIGLAAYAVGTFFISRSFPEIRIFLIRQIPPRLRDEAQRIKDDLCSGVGLWLRSQLMLILITFGELTLAFTLLGVRYATVVAALTAAVDALPVFGTGTVLLPWALVSLLGGNSKTALGLTATYVIVTVARSFLEPRIVSSGFGVDPAASLIATYSGFRFAGVWGMLLFPLGLMLVKQMNDKGYIRLWK